MPSSSFVQISGVIDAGVSVGKLQRESAKVKFLSGGYDTSKIRLIGREALGNGNYAHFKLMAPFDLDTGEGRPRLFASQASFGLGGNWGEFALGHIGALASDLGTYSNFWGTAYSTYFADQPIGNVYSAYIMNYHLDNAIVYVTPPVNGFKMSFMYSNQIGGAKIESEEKKWSKNNHYYGVSAALKTEKTLTTAIWEMYDNKGLENNPKATQRFTFGTSYDFPSLTLYGGYQLVLNSNVLPGFETPVEAFTEKHTFKKGVNNQALSLSAATKVYGGNLMLQTQLGWGHFNDTTQEGVKSSYHTWSIGSGYLYPLSKRTNIYAYGAFGSAGGALKKPTNNLGTANWGLKGWTTMLGMSHNF